jgi:hypothetical protein
VPGQWQLPQGLVKHRVVTVIDLHRGRLKTETDNLPKGGADSFVHSQRATVLFLFCQVLSTGLPACGRSQSQR